MTRSLWMLLSAAVLSFPTVSVAEERARAPEMSCKELPGGAEGEAYAAGLIDGAVAFAVSFLAEAAMLKRDGDLYNSERSELVARAITEKLEPSKQRSMSELLGLLEEGCAITPNNVALLHFITALDRWRRTEPASFPMR